MVPTPDPQPGDLPEGTRPSDAPFSAHAVNTMLERVYQLSAGLCLFVLVVLVPFVIVRKTFPALAAFIGLLAALAGIMVVRRGQARRSVVMMMVSVWVASALMAVGGLPQVMMPLVLATTVVVAIVVGSRNAALFGGSFLLFWLLIRTGTEWGWLSPILYDRPWITWIMAVTSFAMILLPILALLDEQRRALHELTREIAERRRVEGAIREAMNLAEAANRAKSEFLANMSHEIRTPMNGILGMLQLTMLTELTANQRSKLGHAEDAARSLLRIIDDILDLSKIEAGRLELESAPFSLDEVLERLQRMLHQAALTKGLLLRLTVDPEVPRRLMGDPLRLGQVLLNLGGNAIKFTERGSVDVHVGSLEQKGDLVGLVFSIRDTGIGIEEADQARLFHAFSQADTSTTRRFGGTGLGLTISKSLVEQMGGRITIQSVRGQGSEFRFTAYFPALPASKSVSSASVASLATADKPLSGAKVLLVDDHRVNQEVAKAMLVGAGAEVDIAEDGARAIEMVERQAYDVVLMDIQMPVMDGLLATRRLRADPRFADLPIIAMTANALKGDRETCLQAGMNDYFTKPIDRDLMVSMVQTYRGGVSRPT